jgi:hypothetical protein
MEKQSRTARQAWMFEKIEQWKESGITQKQFCQEHEIALSNFFYWHKKHRKHSPSTPGFIPIAVHSNIKGSSSIEIIYPNGVRIQLPSTMHPSAVGEFIRMF